MACVCILNKGLECDDFNYTIFWNDVKIDGSALQFKVVASGAFCAKKHILLSQLLLDRHLASLFLFQRKEAQHFRLWRVDCLRVLTWSSVALLRWIGKLIVRRLLFECCKLSLLLLLQPQVLFTRCFLGWHFIQGFVSHSLLWLHFVQFPLALLYLFHLVCQTALLSGVI